MAKLCVLNLEVPYPFIPANTPLGHCPSPLEQWPPQLANRDHPSSRSTVTQRISPPPAAQPLRETPAALRQPPTALTQVAHCTHTGCPLDSPRLPAALTQPPTALTQVAHWSHPGCPLDSPRLPTGLTQVARTR